MRVRDLYEAIGNSTLSPEAECVVIENELGVSLEEISPPAPVPVTPSPTPPPEDPAEDKAEE